MIVQVIVKVIVKVKVIVLANVGPEERMAAQKWGHWVGACACGGPGCG